MKKISILIVAFIFCITGHAQKFNLELNLTKGETYMQNMISHVSLKQTINGTEMKINMTITGKMSYKIIDLQNSIYDMEVKYLSLAMSMELPTGKVEFDSEKKDSTDIFSSLLKKMKNKPFYLKMTKTGQINEVTKIEELFSSMFEKMSNISEPQKQQLQNQLKQAYGEKAFKGNIQMCSQIFPDKPVAVGDTWTINNKLESGMEANIVTSFELKENNELYYLIHGTSKIATADTSSFFEINGMKLKFDLSGSMDSEIKIDKKNGWTISSKIGQILSGNFQIKANDKVPTDMTIPMSMSNDMSISQN